MEIKDILSYVRRSKAKNDSHVIGELKAQLAKHEATIQGMMAASAASTAAAGAGAVTKKSGESAAADVGIAGVEMVEKKVVSQQTAAARAASPLRASAVPKSQAKNPVASLQPQAAPPLRIVVPDMPPLTLSRPAVEPTAVPSGPAGILRGASGTMGRSSPLPPRSGQSSPTVQQAMLRQQRSTQEQLPLSGPASAGIAASSSRLSVRTAEGSSAEVTPFSSTTTLSGVNTSGKVSKTAPPPLGLTVPRVSSWLVETEQEVGGGSKVSTPLATSTDTWSFTQPTALPPK